MKRSLLGDFAATKSATKRKGKTFARFIPFYGTNNRDVMIRGFTASTTSWLCHTGPSSQNATMLFEIAVVSIFIRVHPLFISKSCCRWMPAKPKMDEEMYG